MKKRVSGIALAAVGTLLVGGVLAGCGDEADAADEQVDIIEVTVDTDQYVSLDLGQPDPNVGDRYVYSGILRENGREVGHGGGSCEFVRIVDDQTTMQCVLSADFEHGSVTMQALWVEGTSPLDMAITGGTGAYRDARGIFRFWDIATPQERARGEITHRTPE
ncbi:hypothetical protein ACFXNW_06615 [Nocardia sp. NPDC059180]|uniref:allene oxide cyclase barrel-like domain-containing protein n=1 Tax=Nocardia sp. NPDC059180 TaxID=3346761 RepID=UPI003676A5C2